jgi:hypothetical protein
MNTLDDGGDLRGKVEAELTQTRQKPATEDDLAHPDPVASVARAPGVVTAQAHAFVVVHATGVANVTIGRSSPAGADRTYPHVFDINRPEGIAIAHISQARDDARAALVALGDADMGEIETRLAQIAVSISKAHELVTFNGSLAAACTYIRRSVLTATADSVTRGALNSLIAVLNQLTEDPMLTLARSAELVESLATEGWTGEHQVAQRMIELWLSSQDEEVQSEAGSQIS